MANLLNRKILISPTEMLGMTIDGRYELESIVGGGGMGVVFKTKQPNLNRSLAIKILKFDDSTDDIVLKRFEREVEIVASLSHPNIVHVVEAGRDDATGLRFIVMELVEGATLESLLKNNRMTIGLALHIASQICAALTEPHEAGVVHRDIKPANIIITKLSDDSVRAKLLDFGIARGIHADDESGRITTTSTVIGSPAYMAPEAASGSNVDHRSDLYSLGIVLYEMLSGDIPFRGATPVAILLRHAVETPPRLDEAIPDFGYPKIVEFVDQLLSKEKDDRPQNAKIALKRLQVFIQANAPEPIRGQVGATTEISLKAYLLRSNFDEVGNHTADPYSPTSTWDSGEHSNPEGFDGWLVPESVFSTITVDQPSDVPQVTKSKSWIVILVLITIAAAIAGAILYEPTQIESQPVELGTQEPAVAEPKTDTTHVKANTPDPIVDIAPVVVPEPKIDPPKKTTKKNEPTSKKTNEEKTEKDTSKTGFDKGLEWLENK